MQRVISKVPCNFSTNLKGSEERAVRDLSPRAVNFPRSPYASLWEKYYEQPDA